MEMETIEKNRQLIDTAMEKYRRIIELKKKEDISAEEYDMLLVGLRMIKREENLAMKLTMRQIRSLGLDGQHEEEDGQRRIRRRYVNLHYFVANHILIQMYKDSGRHTELYEKGEKYGFGNHQFWERLRCLIDEHQPEYFDYIVEVGL